MATGSFAPSRGAVMTKTFPVVSADSDHRLRSIEPFGLRLGHSTI